MRYFYRVYTSFLRRDCSTHTIILPSGTGALHRFGAGFCIDLAQLCHFLEHTVQQWAFLWIRGTADGKIFAVKLGEEQVSHAAEALAAINARVEDQLRVMERKQQRAAVRGGDEQEVAAAGFTPVFAAVTGDVEGIASQVIGAVEELPDGLFACYVVIFHNETP